MIGSTLGHYRILDLLGEGGMGQVFLAEDEHLGRRVALKLLPEEMAARPERISRFRREARTIAALNHPNIVTIFSVEDAEGSTFLTMEYMDGETLGSRIRTGGIPLDEFLEIARSLAEALAVAHEHGITHRDLKPANVMFTRDGRVKILDFGLAKLQEGSSPGEISSSGIEEPTMTFSPELTEPGTVLGTMPYMSPEQAQGASVDHRSDIFSLGVVLYELLTGKRPFRGDSSAELISSILRDSPEEVTRVRVDLPSHLGRVIRRCLEKNPVRRFQSARDLALELDELAEGGGKEKKTAPSIGVLPFADMSAERDQDYFCEGIAEELINGLGRVETMQVASRTSSFQYGNTSADVREIGRQLGVAHILEGSVRKAGDRIRISAQLVKVSDGYRLWSDRYDREMKDIFAIQDEIAESIVEALEVTLSPRERRAIQNVATSQVEAYDFYLRGRKYFYAHNRESQEYARELYSQAIEIDPSYALAYAGIADCCSFLYMYSEASDENMRLADENSRRALELAPELAEAHASRGLALTLTKNFDQAEAAFEEALRLDPKLFEAYYYSGRNYLAQGHYEEAEELLRRASEVRPEDYQALKFLAQGLTSMGREEEVDKVYREIERRVEEHVRMNPDDSRAFIFGASARFGLGDREGALEWTDRAREIAPDEPMVLYNVACCYSLGHQVEDAIDTLERAVAEGWRHKEWIEHDSDLTPLHDHPRYKALLAGM